MVKIALNKALTARDKKIYNLLVRELLLLNVNDFKNNEISFNLNDLSKSLGITTRQDLYESLERLLSTIITFETPRDNSFLKNHNKGFLQTRAVMISSYSRPIYNLLEYDNENDEYNTKNLIVRFDTKLTETILKYSSNYVKLDLTDISKLKITHSITLYELFIRSLGTFNYQKQNISEADLRKYLHLENKYTDIKSFTSQVIKKSINELNKITKLSISYKRVKIDNQNIFKFEINQDFRYSFNKFKKCIIENYNYVRFFYNGNQYSFSKDEDDKKSKYLIINDKTFKTLQTEKAIEIFKYMYKILNSNSADFVLQFVINKNLNDAPFDINDLDENDLAEVNHFMNKYQETKV